MPITTDEEALLAAISDAPLDEAPRLIYADWLQERNQDARAEYIRAVTKLLLEPYAPIALARCQALGAEIDSNWCKQVGGQFEVVLEGSGPLLLLAHVVRAIVNLAQEVPTDFWQARRPVTIRQNLTRENAEQIVRSFGVDQSEQESVGEPALKFIVRAMSLDSLHGGSSRTPVNPFAPGGPPD